MTLYEESPERLPPELQDAVRVAVAVTSRLAPPSGYDSSYWREERVAIANLAVWQAYLCYQPERGIPLERFATLCAVRAIVKEWKRLNHQGQALVAMPVDEETGEEREFEDPEAQSSIEEAVLCGVVREAIKQLPEAYQEILDRHYGEGWSVCEIAEALGKSKSWVHKSLQRALEFLKRCCGE